MRQYIRRVLVVFLTVSIITGSASVTALAKEIAKSFILY